MKIWFQNKRSKYKKIMKHGSGSEGEHLHSTSSISPCSPGLPQLWEVSMANKGAQMHPNNYMNSFGHWYPNHHHHHHHPHQDAVPRPQMMWAGTVARCAWDASGRRQAVCSELSRVFFMCVCVCFDRTSMCFECVFFSFSSDTQIYFLDLLWCQSRLHGAHLTDVDFSVCSFNKRLDKGILKNILCACVCFFYFVFFFLSAARFQHMPELLEWLYNE